MTEFQTIMLTRLRLEFDVDTTPADGLEGAALDQWIERAKAEREAAANAARSEAAKEQPRNADGTMAAGVCTDGTRTGSQKPSEERTNMAAATGTNRGAVAKAKAMHNLATRLGVLDVFQLFKDGKINAADCDRTLRGIDRARGLIAQVAHKLSDHPQLQQEWLDSANDRMDMGALQSLRIAIEARKPQEVINTRAEKMAGGMA